MRQKGDNKVTKNEGVKKVMKHQNGRLVTAGIALLAALLSGQARSATPREIWLEKMQMVCGKVLKAQAEGTLRKDLPLDPRRVTKKGAQKPNPQSAPFEAFARALIGISAWLELPPSDDAEGQLRAQYLDWAKRGIINSVDPSSPGYLKFGHEKQSLVECAYISQAAAIAQKQLWEVLPQKTQEAFCEELLSNVYKPYDNNWLLFGTLQHLFVLEHGTPAQRERVQPARIVAGLRTFMEQYYKGDGWYSDGKDFHFDNYNSYVIHPMLHDAFKRIAALPEESRRRLELSDTELEHWREEETKRFRRYAQIQERLIMADGSYPQFGRSGQYRFGCFQALSYASYLAGRGEFAAPCDPGQVRSALTAVLERQCTGVNFNPQGWMLIGFNGNQPWTSEMYGTPGSVYLCSAIFHVLGLPPDAPFWTAPAKDWTAKSAWAGEKYTRDHAL